MDDFKRMDSLTQTKLTRAIEKAATLAMGSEQDRNKILAQQLKKDDVPKELTKTATAAFNRRLSVITLVSRDQETKADNFSLADYDKVAELRGCPSIQKKASVVNAPFCYSISKSAMQKKASVKKQQPVRITIEQAMKKLGSLVDITAVQFQQALQDVQQQEVVLQSLLKKASKELNNDIKTGNLLATVYGDTYRNLFRGRVEQKALQKRASYAILPKNMTVQLVEKAIQQADVVSMKKDLLDLKKNAAALLAQEVTNFQQSIKRLCLQGMSKKADLSDIPREALVNAITIPGLLVGGAAQGALSTASQYAKDVASLLSQRYAIHPQAAITAELLHNDRYDDKANRLIDVLADQDFKNYRVQDIQKVVSSVISQHPQFVSPRYKQYLKVAVMNRLLAGGKTNTATQAAEAQLFKSISQTDKTLNEASIINKIKEMKPVQSTELNLASLLPIIKAPEKIQQLLPAYGMQNVTKQLSNFIQQRQKTREQIQQQKAQRKLEGFKEYNKARDRVLNYLKYRQLKDLNIAGFTNHTDPRLRNIDKAMVDSINNPSDIAKVLNTDQLQALQQIAASKLNKMDAPSIYTMQNALGRV